jgi:hypothetical protein
MNGLSRLIVTTLAEVMQGINFINVTSFMNEPQWICLISKLSHRIEDKDVTSSTHFSLV